MDNKVDSKFKVVAHSGVCNPPGACYPIYASYPKCLVHSNFLVCCGERDFWVEGQIITCKHCGRRA
jgi:hypothetical protein